MHLFEENSVSKKVFFPFFFLFMHTFVPILSSIHYNIYTYCLFYLKCFSCSNLNDLLHKWTKKKEKKTPPWLRNFIHFPFLSLIIFLFSDGVDFESVIHWGFCHWNFLNSQNMNHSDGTFYKYFSRFKSLFGLSL